MPKLAKNEISGPYFKFGRSLWLDIALLTQKNVPDDLVIISHHIRSLSGSTITDVEPVRSTLQFSTSVEVRPGNVGPCVRPLVSKSYREPTLGFLSFFAWMFLTIRLRNVHGGFSRKNPDHSIITKTCQKWPFFDFDRILFKITHSDFPDTLN